MVRPPIPTDPLQPHPWQPDAAPFVAQLLKHLDAGTLPSEVNPLPHVARGRGHGAGLGGGYFINKVGAYSGPHWKKSVRGNPHRKPMALKYRACAQNLTRWNLHPDPSGPEGPEVLAVTGKRSSN